MFKTGNVKADIQPDTSIVLLEDVIYDDFIIPAGYASDGASVPRALSWLYPKYGEYLKAAVVHDWLITDLLPTGNITSTQVDQVFKQAMAELNIPKARQWLMWAGVRLGAIGNKRRRRGSLRTFPKVLLVILLASPVVLLPSLMVQIILTLLWLLSLLAPRRQKVNSQKT